MLPLKNSSFEVEQNLDLQCPVNWGCSAHADGKAYRFTIDRTIAAHGKQSLLIERAKPEPWGIAGQLVDARHVWNKTVILRGQVRTSGLHDKGVHGAGGGLFVHALDMPGEASYRISLVPNDGPWQPLSVELRVPAGTHHLRVGAILEGGGQLWVDDLSLRVKE